MANDQISCRVPQRRAVEKGIQMFGWDACRIARLANSRTCADMRRQLLALGGVPMVGTHYKSYSPFILPFQHCSHLNAALCTLFLLSQCSPPRMIRLLCMRNTPGIIHHACHLRRAVCAGPGRGRSGARGARRPAEGSAPEPPQEPLPGQ